MDQSSALPVVAIVGRPNVGKSTLFNRLVGHRAAIVMDTPGVTRDRHYLPVNWFLLNFTLVDTGGVDFEGEGVLDREVGDQSLRAVPEADLVLFMTDAREGVTTADREVAETLRRSGVPVIHMVNKADTEALEHQAMEAASLGFEHIVPVSVEHSRGLDPLYDMVCGMLPEAMTAGMDDEVVRKADPNPISRVAVLGRPNVGKSTLINRLLGEDRLVVSDVPGTTRDAIDSRITYKGTEYLFIDTAGIRRRGRIDKGVERASIGRTMGALERAEVAVLLMDAEEGVTEQDTKIAGQILRTLRSCILVVNKWDIKKGDDEARKWLEKELDRLFPFLEFAPVLFLSGQTGHNMPRLFAAIDKVTQAFRRRIPTGELNRTVEQLIAHQPPPLLRHRPVKIYYATQVGAAPPRFVLFTNQPEGLGKGYLRYLENGLREAFDFTGTPVRISVRHRSKDKRGKQARHATPGRLKPAKHKPGKRSKK
ncbi:MAG: ribosome biogenesis GTPase Der [Leptospirillia bacterium]